MVARSELGRRWRSVVVLTLLVGFVGAIVLASAAGARRSDRALPRFNDASRSSNLSLLPAISFTPSPAQLNALRHVHNVAGLAVVRFYTVVRHATAGLGIGAAVDGAFGNAVDRPRLISGRLADPAAPDEVTIGEVLAGQLHLKLGDHIDVESYSAAQLASALATGSGQPAQALGPRVRLRVVGIVRRPLDLGDAGAQGGVMVLTPAFNRKYTGVIGTLGVIVTMRIRNGETGVPAVVAAARRIFGKRATLSVSSSGAQAQGAQNAIDVLTAALWIFAGVAALAGVVAIGIVLSREVSLMSGHQATLHALGLTRAQRIAVGAPAALFIAGGGAVLAVLVAIAASPLFPIGLARRAAPDVGLHADWLVLALGAVLTAAVIAAVSVTAALRATKRSALELAPAPQRRRSTLVELAADAGAPPTATNGVRMAVQSGRGGAAIPVRSALIGAIFGVLGVSGVLMFSSSLNHLVTTPRLYGWTWDFKAADTNFSNDGKGCNRKDFGLAHEPGVAVVAAVCYDDVPLDGRPVTGWGFTPVHGAIEPEVVAGRAPHNAHEVALGSVTLNAMHKHVGDIVHGRSPSGKSFEYRIVGRIVLPTLDDPQALADGAAFTGPGLLRIFDSNSKSQRYLVGSFTPGIDRAAVEHRIAAIPQLGNPAGPTVAVEVDRLRKIEWLPMTLTALLAGLALLAVGHALITSVRRRRRDLALLKTLGFNRRQVRATIAWLATALATVGLVVGIPIGIIVGRIVWQRVADGLGVSTVVTVPTIALLLVVPAVLALVNLLAFFPARAAANTRPAVALRSE